MRRAFGGVLLAIALLGCGGDSGPDENSVEGAWSGIVRNNSGSAVGEMSITLNETDGDVSGAGSISNVGESIAFSADGIYSEPDLTLTLSASGFEDINLSAQVGETSITGTLNGSGFINSTITLNRP